MLSFAEPGWLALLPLPLLGSWLTLRRPAPALRYPSLALVAGLSRGRARRAVVGPATLRATGLTLVIVAAGGPRLPDLSTPLPVEGVSVMLALDVSGSMAARDFPESGRRDGTRLDAARSAYRLFVIGGEADGVTLPGRPRDAIGLVAFAAVPRTVCPLTLSHATLLQLLDAQQPRTGPDAGTNVGDAITEAVLRLDTPGPRRKVLILLSDGETNAPTGDAGAALKPRQAANLAKSLGITIYAIDCGGEPTAATDAELAQRAAGRDVLAAVARMTGGRYFEADSGDGMVDACRAIDELERHPLDSFRSRRYRPLGHWGALAAVGCLSLATIAGATRWRVNTSTVVRSPR
jgi:Ca-activated chloride channel family protein